VIWTEYIGSEKSGLKDDAFDAEWSDLLPEALK